MRCGGSPTFRRLLAADGSVAPAGTEPALARFDGIAGHFSTWAVALLSAPHGTPGGPPGGSPGPTPGGSTPAGPSRAQIRALLRSEITPRGRAGRIRPLRKHGYRLRFRALAAGTANVAWYRVRKSRTPVLIAQGRHTFAAAGRTTIAMKLTAAGRRQLRRAKRLGLTARGSFTPAGRAPVTAARRFTLRRDAPPRTRA